MKCIYAAIVEFSKEYENGCHVKRFTVNDLSNNGRDGALMVVKKDV